MKYLTPRTRGQAKRVGCLAGAARIAAGFAHEALLNCQSGSTAVLDEDDVAYFTTVLVDDLERRFADRAPAHRESNDWLRPKR